MTTFSTGATLLLPSQTAKKVICFEACCALKENDPLWNNLRNISIEIGYPGIKGTILWKRIGWLQTGSGAFNRTIAHALWDRTTAAQVLLFDFQPVLMTGAGNLEKSYRLRKTIIRSDGHTLSQREVRIKEGRYADEYFVLQVDYPVAENVSYLEHV
jgi:hypothetical protein